MKKEAILSPKSIEEVLSIFPEKNMKVLKKDHDSSASIVVHFGRKGSWSRTFLGFVVYGELYKDQKSTLIVFRILPGASTVVSLIVWFIALMNSLIQTLIIQSYIEKTGAYIFMGLALFANLVLIITCIYCTKEIRDTILQKTDSSVASPDLMHKSQ